MTDELLAPDDPIKALRARQLLQSAAKAVDAFEDAIRELVAMRAWTVLGYQDLATMWEAENGFKCPTYAKVLAVEAMTAEGMNTKRGFDSKRQPLIPDGHTNADVARAVGLPLYDKGDKGKSSPAIGYVRRQLDAGVPADKVSVGSNADANLKIARHGTRARPQPRRMGKAPDELVQDGFYLPRRDADAVGEIARRANVGKSEIYRQAVAEYLQRHNVSTHFGHAPNGATPEVGEAVTS
jgi:hypothetical protein